VSSASPQAEPHRGASVTHENGRQEVVRHPVHGGCDGEKIRDRRIALSVKEEGDDSGGQEVRGLYIGSCPWATAGAVGCGKAHDARWTPL
jgi:hypothetical protein